MKIKDLTGKKFGRLLVIKRVFSGKKRSDGCNEVWWLTHCDCGKEINVRSGGLRSGNTTSCGCRLHDTLMKRNVSHSMTGSKTYECWQNMKKRCQNNRNPAFKNYGARGITVCPRWEKFENFLEDMGLQPEGLTLDRIDNSRGYFPDNCRWATRLEQASNLRKPRLLTHHGETLSMRQWDKKIGLCYGAISMRLQRGWSVQKALETPNLGFTKEGHCG